VRHIDDVLAGYRATGEFDPQRWLIVRQAGQDVGCLLLAVHPETDQWELVYLGVTPAARGAGLGRQIVRHAQWMCQRGGARQLVLAVDADNTPALKLYASAGFVAWDRRPIYLHVLTRDAT
jgi:mycothiol synthase